MDYDQTAVRKVLGQAQAAGRTSLSAPSAKLVCDAYGVAVAKQGLATSAEQAVRLGVEIGYPVAMKVVSPDILHKTEAGCVITGVADADAAASTYAAIIRNAKAYKARAVVEGVEVQEMVGGGPEIVVGALSDPTFGKLVAFGLGGILVEVLRDVTFRLAPVTHEEALSMLGAIRATQVLEGVRGAAAADRKGIATLIQNVSCLVSDFPEIAEIDLNPVFARPDGPVAADVRIVLDFAPPKPRYRPSREEIMGAMNRIMKPDSVAVIGASPEEGKIGNSVIKNLIGGGYQGAIYPINPRAREVLGLRAYRSVKEVPGDIDIAVFAIPARLVASALEECGKKKVAGAILIPSGFAETGNVRLQEEVVEVARRYGVRLMGPNIYGFYYTPKNLCATFCTPYDVKGKTALSSQSGGVGMAIVGFSRSTKMGVSAIVGLGNKSDIDEDDLLTFFEQDDNTEVIAMHVEDLKDGRAFAEVAHRVSKTKPVIVLKAGRTALGARAARSHTAALAGNDKVYDDVLRQCGVVRAHGLDDMLEFARCIPMMPAPKGENVVIITGAGGSGVLLADACVDNGLELMTMPTDLDAAFRKFIPPFGAAGNPVDITGGEPPSTYRNAIRLGLEDRRVHALILGYWHTVITPPMVFAKLLGEVVEECRLKGIEKPIVASLVGDVEVEQACAYLFERRIPAYPYTTERPVTVLGAKYAWARAAGLIAPHGAEAR
jgi:acetyl coenzyme A synthetase (ADP forming)-like protein